MNIKRRLTGAAAVLLACIAALVFAALVPARAIPPSGGRQYRGIDISEFQGEIDFEEVRRSGIEAVYIRVGAGEYTDDFGPDSFSADSEAKITITGGEIHVNASGDGLDSNGDIEISGGTVYVYGPTSSGNGSLDYEN